MIHLVNPNERAILDNAGDRIPLGLISIATYLKSRGLDTKVYDLNHEDENDLVRNVMRDNNSLVGISVYTSPSYNEALRLSQRLRPHSRLVAGGHHATHMPESLTPYFDTVIKGEGEEAILAAQKVDGVISAHPPTISQLPRVDFGFVNMDRYGVNQEGKRTATLITSRGCPYECAFCGKLESKVRYDSVEHVRKQIEDLMELGFNSVYFLDDVFTLRQERMQEIVQASKLNGITFRATTRANLIDNKKLEVLADNGCEWLSFGIESGDNRILAKSNKGMTVEENYFAVRDATKHGINTKGFFIIGLPGETESTARRTIDYSLLLRDTAGLKTADFYYLTPFPGTPIWNNPKSFGVEITDTDYTKYLQAGKTARCVVNTEGLKASRIEELVEEARQEWKS